jgi:hypothetical protein
MRESSWKSPEFLLVVVMLFVLLLLVLLILWAPIPNVSSDAEATMALDYRKNILTVIITAFGAWVGAGAAYYFGRENLREASQSLLPMRSLVGPSVNPGSQSSSIRLSPNSGLFIATRGSCKYIVAEVTMPRSALTFSESR